MRKAQKQQVLDMLSQMKEAHEQVKRYIGQGSIPQALELLTDCQNGAISIGTLIEKTEGEGHQTVSLLEAYCELIYQIYQKLEENSKDINAHKFEKQLQQKLLEVINSVKNDIPTRTEVVFLPYKASMWDSLESVWKAADEDPNCDTYVIPIPYYDRNPDGSFREMHYEGDQYPDYVPVTWYENYDFEVRKPDTIFIHNPYDEANFVTSVHPSFYSKKLKEYTEKLVYIPYFILGECTPDDQKSVEGMKNFCVIPGVLNADKVVVQSEDMRQVYIKVLTNAFGKETKEHWSQKILGLGSPKVDKVLNTRKEDLEIPDEWLKIIQKPDGSWKKIIFYNTGLSTLLIKNEKMLEKIRDTFHVFRSDKDEVTLLWRPHPLINATIKSMRPQLGESYQQLVEQYKKEGWGIYDDSADMDRAVVLSDAYYGDSSSVQWLFQKAGKQFIIQDVEWKNYIHYSIAATEAITYINGEYWYVPYWGNGLYRMDGNTFEAKKEEVFHEKENKGLFSGIVSYGEKLFFIPRIAELIYVYDVCEQEMDQLQFQGNVYCVDSGVCKFSAYSVIGDCLYLIPANYHSVVIIHMDTNMIEQYPVHDKKENKKICNGNAVVIDKYIYFAYRAEGCILRFDSERKTIDKIFPGNEKRVYTHLFHVNRKLWLIPFDVQDGIRVWNVQQNEFENIITFPNEIIEKTKESEIARFPEEIADSLRNGDSAYFSSGVLHGKDIHLLAGFLGKNVVIHTEEKICELWDFQPECFEPIMYTWMRSLKFISYLQKDDELYAISGLSGEWYQYKNNVWKKVEKQASIIRDGKKVLLMDREVLMDYEMKKLQNPSSIGKEVYLKLKKEQE